MKKVLITGANSFIGTSFEEWIHRQKIDFIIDTLDLKDRNWKEYSFAGYDTVFHVAGIAHADVEQITEVQQELYYRINCDLAIECAKKAREDGAAQFIYMSSMIVYGESAGVGETKIITKDSPLNPANFYGDSKVKAEEGLLPLTNDAFKVVILRPPMIYGKGSKGNYPMLSKLASKLPIFPTVQNQRSMLYIGNFCKLVTLLIQNGEQGIFFPQNREYVATSDMVKAIAEAKGKKVHCIKGFQWLMKLLGRTNGKIGKLTNKAFGNFVYDKEISQYSQEYQIYDLKESIQNTEGTGA